MTSAKGFASIISALGSNSVETSAFLPYDADLLDPKSRKSKLLATLDPAVGYAFNFLLREGYIPGHVEKFIREDHVLWDVLTNYERYFQIGE